TTRIHFRMDTLLSECNRGATTVWLRLGNDCGNRGLHCYIQTLDVPAESIIAANELGGLWQVEFQHCRIPLQSCLRETRGDAAKKHCFRKRSGIQEVRRSARVACASVNKFAP